MLHEHIQSGDDEESFIFFEQINNLENHFAIFFLFTKSFLWTKIHSLLENLFSNKFCILKKNF